MLLCSEEICRRNSSTRGLGGPKSRSGRFGKTKENVLSCRRSKCESSVVLVVAVNMANPNPEIRSGGRVNVVTARPDFQLHYTDRVTRLLFAVSDSKYSQASLNDGDTF